MRMTLVKLSAGLALTMAVLQPALAAEWQYCLAPSHAEHKIYMSPAFPVRGSLDEAGSAFELMLDQAGLQHDVVQCPRADDEQSILSMQQYAISFNRQSGNTIVHLPPEARDQFGGKPFTRGSM
jgi:hypothetical protein